MELQPVRVLVVVEGDENTRKLLRDLAENLGAEVAEVTLSPTLVPFDTPEIKLLEIEVRQRMHEAAEARHLVACAREVVERPAQVNTDGEPRCASCGAKHNELRRQASGGMRTVDLCVGLDGAICTVCLAEGVERAAFLKEHPCTCPKDKRGERVPSHECARHG